MLDGRNATFKLHKETELSKYAGPRAWDSGVSSQISRFLTAFYFTYMSLNLEGTGRKVMPTLHSLLSRNIPYYSILFFAGNNLLLVRCLEAPEVR